jgi:hypothetical protein
MRPMPKIHRIRLTESERDDLLRRQRRGSTKSAWHRAATILLLADENAPEGPLADTAIARAVHASVRTVERIRERALCEGIDSVLTRKPHSNPKAPLLDGAAEARLIALCCGNPPEGRACWTLQLLADKLIELQIVPAISDESVRRTLKKTLSSPGAKSSGACPRRAALRLSVRWRT